MAKKFVNVTGLHNVFASLDDFNSGTIKSTVADKVDANSVLYITCDDLDFDIFGAPYYENCTLTYASKKPYAISGSFIKTFNNNAPDKNGNISFSANVPVNEMPESEASVTLTANEMYIWATAPESLDVTLDESVATDVVNIYMMQFTTGDTAPEMTWPESVSWVSSTNVEANKTYQVAILNNIGLITSVSAS